MKRMSFGLVSVSLSSFELPTRSQARYLFWRGGFRFPGCKPEPLLWKGSYFEPPKSSDFIIQFTRCFVLPVKKNHLFGSWDPSIFRLILRYLNERGMCWGNNQPISGYFEYVLPRPPKQKQNPQNHSKIRICFKKGLFYHWLRSLML